MTASKNTADVVKLSRPARKDPVEGAGEDAALQMGELSELLGYVLKRGATENLRGLPALCRTAATDAGAILRAVAARQESGRNQTEIANTLGILRPNFRGHAGRAGEPRSAGADAFGERSPLPHPGADRQGPAVLARAKKLVATKHEARLNESTRPRQSCRTARDDGENWHGSSSVILVLRV